MGKLGKAFTDPGKMNKDQQTKAIIGSLFAPGEPAHMGTVGALEGKSEQANKDARKVPQAGPPPTREDARVVAERAEAARIAQAKKEGSIMSQITNEGGAGGLGADDEGQVNKRKRLLGG